MSTAPLKQAIASARAILDEVTSDHMDVQTPCAAWKVSDLINHIVGAQHFFIAGASGQPPSGGGEDVASNDFLAAFDDATSKLLALLDEDGMMEKMLSLPFGQMPGAALAGLAATDTFTHAWDLAKSLGRSTDLAPQLAAGLLAAAKASIQESFRGGEGAPFGPEQQAPEGASNADQLAAFLGRSVD
jgi:uncharacterized protein (TIGR03086 family)